MGDAQGQRTRQGNPRADLHIINENFDRRYKAELIADYQKAYATQLKNEPLRIFVSHSDDDHMRGLVSILSTFHKSIEKPLRVPNTPLLLDYATSWREISDRFARALAAQMTVVSDPEIRGGEPVVRGTRIPVSLLHDLVEQGASQEEILADYPALDAERLDLALLYAKTHPRVGRPRKGPWHPS
jgi:uncharacterized protein (DUF433 family)